jgi:hypothetical protein
MLAVRCWANLPHDEPEGQERPRSSLRLPTKAIRSPETPRKFECDRSSHLCDKVKLIF